MLSHYTVILLMSSLSVHQHDIPAFPEEENIVRTELNEIIRTNLPDPGLIQIGDNFFLSGTEDRHGVFHMYHSTDLIRWRPVGVVFTQENRPEWVDQRQPNFWGPAFRYNPHTGLFYCFYSARIKNAIEGRSRFALAVATAPHITGPWTDHGPIYSGGGLDGREEGHGSVIDPVPFTDVDGRTWIFWQEEFFGRWIGMGELSPDWLEIIADSRQIIYRPAAPWESWENNICEGFAVVLCDDTYTLFYSGGGYTYGGGYAVGILQADHIQGPWTPYEHNPILYDDTKRNAPGCLKALVQLKNGDWWGIHHGYVNRRGFSWSRSLYLDKMIWDENGIPQFTRLESFGKEHPHPEHSNLLFSGRFAGIQDDLWPWQMYGKVNSFEQDGHRTVQLGPDARIEQNVLMLPKGEYTLHVNVSSETGADVQISLRTENGEVLGEHAEKVLNNTHISIDFMKLEGMHKPICVSLSIETSTGSVIVDEVRLYPRLIGQLEAEYGLTTGEFRCEWFPNASMGTVVSSLYRVGQELAFPVAYARDSGWYKARLRYATPTPKEEHISLDLYVNGVFARRLEGHPTDSPESFQEIHFPIKLEAGDNLVDLRYGPANQGTWNLDVLYIDRCDEIMQNQGMDIPTQPTQKMHRFTADFVEKEQDRLWHIVAYDEHFNEVKMEPLHGTFMYVPDDPWCRGGVVWLNPGEHHEIGIEWIAPRNGQIKVMGVIRKFASTRGDGILFSILHNGRPFWPSDGPMHVTDPNPFTSSSLCGYTSVKAGDTITFLIQKNNDNHHDLTFVDPVIVYLN